MQEDQSSSDETEETDDEETIQRNQTKERREMENTVKDRKHEKYLKARTAVITGLPPRKTADQRDELTGISAAKWEHGHSSISIQKRTSIHTLAKIEAHKRQ